MTIAKETKEQAKALLLQGLKKKEVSAKIGISRAVLDPIAREVGPVKTTAYLLRTRLEALVSRENKTELEILELSKLTDNLLQAEKQELELNNYIKSGKPKDLNPERYERNGRPNNKTKNDITGFTPEVMERDFLSKLFKYQRNLYDNRHHRIRNIVKSRQIGLTFYFALEALNEAIITGKNQIFISASKAQSEIFLDYIKDFALKTLNLELKGKEKIVLSNGAKLLALSTNSRTAQGFNGDVYFDEYFWTPYWEKLRKLASAQATHSRFRLTYFSTPSSTTHEAYAFWNGDFYNKGRPKKEQVHLDVSKKALKLGRLDPDTQWRRVITLEMARAEGNNLFDIEQLKKECSLEEFKNIYQCDFIDDRASVFSLPLLNKCCSYADNVKVDRPVWIGFDPSRFRDKSTCVVVLPPLSPTQSFQVVEVLSWYGENFQTQADNIKALVEKYNVSYLAIDCTGIGAGVYELVKDFYPATTPITYTLESKNNLTIKALNVVEEQRLRWNEEHHKEVARSFLMIKKQVSRSGNVIYYAERNQDNGHADTANAIMLAISNEPLNRTERVSSVEFY